MARSLMWIKLHVSMLSDPKMYRIGDQLHRRAVECFLLAGMQAEHGRLPPLSEMAWTLRLDQDILETQLDQLQKERILDYRDGSWYVRNFDKWQAAAPSTKRWREWDKREKAKRPNVGAQTSKDNTNNRGELEERRGEEMPTTATICPVCGGEGEHVATVDADQEVDTCPVGLGMTEAEAVQRYGRMANP